ncbi:MAG: N(4)-(beta-N-acetylglucosaminyl)-L-asparaginase, partial [Bacteroidota bacterium]
MKRRAFLKTQGYGLLAALVALSGLKRVVASSNHETISPLPVSPKKAEPGVTLKPVVLSTWDYGLRTNAEAWKILKAQGLALDAVIAGAELS